MHGIAHRQSTALGWLHARYRSLLSKIIGEILPGDTDTQETLQDVFAAIWHQPEQFDEAKGKPLGWLICMARRRAIDRYRKIRRRVQANDVLQAQCEEGPRMNGQLLVTGSKEDRQPATGDLRSSLLLIMQGLPPPQIQVIRLAFFEDLSQREIVTRTGIPLGTIKTRLDLAIRKLSQKAMHLRQELR